MTIGGLVYLPLTPDDVSIVWLALRMLHDMATAKAEYAAEAHVRSLLDRLNAAKGEDD